MVLSPRSLPYANLALESLFRHVSELIKFSIITDSEADKLLLREEVHRIADKTAFGGEYEVYSSADLDGYEADLFQDFRQLRGFRRGHPCWRKITDPLLLSAPGEEMVILDPDLYFPNRFSFETTPDEGVLLMWQKPSCLFPPEVVQTAMNAQIPLAHHVDIGVAHWRFPNDLAWLDWLIGQLGSESLPHSMHVEAIVWSAIAMRFGGGHLDPERWHCWHRTQYKRVLRKLGFSGISILRLEKFANVKCFHAGGEAKWWLPDAYQRGMLDSSSDLSSSEGRITSFVELTPSEYGVLQRNRRWLRKLGYYSVFQS